MLQFFYDQIEKYSCFFQFCSLQYYILADSHCLLEPLPDAIVRGTKSNLVYKKCKVWKSKGTFVY